MRARRRAGVGQAALAGAARGVAATVAMSVPMVAEALAGAQRTPPPKRITVETMDAAGADPGSETGRNMASTLAHLAFGATMGAAFSMFRSRLRPPGPAVAHGLAYGLAVWAVSYKGWVPALGIMPRSEYDRPARRRANVFAHLVYGGVLGALDGAGRRRR